MVYALRKEVLSSTVGFAREWDREVEVKSRPRTSHRRPSVAVCFFVLSSLRTRDWRVEESPGEASWRSRTFCFFGGWIYELAKSVAEKGWRRGKGKIP